MMSASRRIHALYSVGTFTGLSDGQLLERFATREGEAAELAFAALVERHGPMVLRVCRRSLGDAHDAQDAFQATFLVLARKAGSLRERGSVGNWLYGVASRVAMDARASSSRRRLHERRYAEQSDGAVAGGDPDRHDLEAVLHEELRRLPERYRAPVVLCHLEGLSHEEAALRLGCPVGTVRSRLARGRGRLKGRLARRGLAPTAGALTAALSGDALAAVPRAFVDFPFLAAARFAAGRAGEAGAVLSIRAVALSQGVIHAMFLTKLKLVAGACLVAGGLFASGAGVTARGGGDGPARVPGVREGGAQVVKSLCYNVYNLVPGEPEILRVLTPGAAVRKGQLVCELDASTLEEDLTNQWTATQKAEFSYRNAELNRKIIELELNLESEENDKRELKEVEGEIALAESDLKRAEDRIEWSDRMLEKKFVSKAANSVDKLSLQRSKLRLEQARTKKEVLENDTREKTRKERAAVLERARSVELARKATWEREEQETKAIRRAIAGCKIHAPADGEMILAPGIEEGVAVRKGQLVFRVLAEDSTNSPR